MDYKNLIAKRRSVRGFKEKSLNDANLNELKDYFKVCKKLISDIDVEMVVLNGSEVKEKLDNIAGYNGIMIEAPNYIILLSDKHEYYIENSGYIGEDLILKATDLEINSCWITVKDAEKVKESLEISSDKEITAIIALGYGEKEQDKVVFNTKPNMNSFSTLEMREIQTDNDRRFDFEDIIFSETWGKSIDPDDLKDSGFYDAFSAARIAPSALNRQPWRFIFDKDKILLLIKKDEYTNLYEHKIAAGIVMLNFAGVVSSTMFELNWKLEVPEKNYNIPNDIAIIGYCNI